MTDIFTTCKIITCPEMLISSSICLDVFLCIGSVISCIHFNLERCTLRWVCCNLRVCLAVWHGAESADGAAVIIKTCGSSTICMYVYYSTFLCSTIVRTAQGSLYTIFSSYNVCGVAWLPREVEICLNTTSTSQKYSAMPQSLRKDFAHKYPAISVEPGTCLYSSGTWSNLEWTTHV